MFVTPNPPGVNRPQDCDRMHIVKVVSGDAWKVEARLVNPSNGMPANYRNTIVRFVLSENKFSRMPIWVGEWSKGVFEDAVVPGLVHVVVPDDVCRELRRGSYAFSMHVSDIDGRNRRTQLSGYFQVEYEPSGDEHDIPYRPDESGSQGIDRYIERMDEERVSQLRKVLEEIATGEGTWGNVEDGVRIIAEFLVGASEEGGGDDKPTPDPDPEQTDVEKTLHGIAGSLDELVDAVVKAIEERKKHPQPPCPPCPPCPPRPPCPHGKPFIIRPPWYRYPNPPKTYVAKP